MNPIPGQVSGNNDASPAAQNSWMKLASDAYKRSTDYFDNNYRKSWENDLRMFQSRHPADSKYNTDAYRFRSRAFRPKSRSVLRKNEATAALAFFSNPDVVSIEAENEDDMAEITSADVMKALLQYRLTKTIPWFLTVIGGFQDAMNVGLVCSLQMWEYEAKTKDEEVTGTMPNGEEVTLKMPQTTVLKDRPAVHLFPIENVRFDPAAHWYDVVSTSPYVILQIPMYLADVVNRMDMEDHDGNSWKKLPNNTILQSRVEGIDPLRQARNDKAEDRLEVQSDVNEFDVVMVHLNFMRQDGQTYAYYTLKDKHLLSEPMLVEEMFLHCKDGRPPVQIGFCVIETHKPVPPSLIGLTSELQREANEINNQRRDNVKYVLNKRNYVRRGSNVDVESLLRNVPGGVTMVNDVEKDVREVNWQDVTASSYEEQNVINVDFDELAGNFAQGSVMTNRKLNETVGGMRIMAQGANMITEYTIRVFVETWLEPVLRQLVQMEQAYETDETVLALVAQKAKVFQRYGTTDVMDSLLSKELTLSVAVGMGATDPDARFEKFLKATGAYQQIVQTSPPGANLKEIRKTLYGLAGFRDAQKYYSDKVDPAVAKAMQIAQAAQGEAQKMIDAEKDKFLQRDRQQDSREAELNLKQAVIDADRDRTKIESNYREAIKKAQLNHAEREAVAGIEEQLHSLTLLREQIEHFVAQSGAELDAKAADVKAGEGKREAENNKRTESVVQAFAASNDKVMKAMEQVVKTLSAPKKLTKNSAGEKVVVTVNG